MELRSRSNRSGLPVGYGRNAPVYDPGLALPSITLGQLAAQGDLDKKQAYKAMKTGQVPASIQSRYAGYQVAPGQRKDFQTDAQTAYSLYLAGKIPEYEALDAIYSGKVADTLQDRFPEVEVLPGQVDEDPTYRFWNAFGLGSLANPQESLAQKVGLMTVGGGLLNVLGKPFDVAQTEILHAADPSDKRTFADRLLHTGDEDKTAKDNFFHSGFIGSRLDPAKYKADAERYDHNAVTQAGAGLLRLSGLDGLVQAVNEDTDKPGVYRGLKGGLSVLGAASQVLPFTEGVGTGLGRGLSTVGRGLGRGASALRRGVAKTVRGSKLGGTTVYGASKPYAFSGTGEADFYASAPQETSLRMRSMEDLASGVDEPAADAPLALPALAKAAAVDPVTLLDRDPTTLSGAEKDALFELRRGQREALAGDSESAESGVPDDGAPAVGGTSAGALPGGEMSSSFDRAVTQALKTSQRRLSNQALFADSRDVLGRAQRAEALADETLAGMKQTSREADQLVDTARGALQDAPSFDEDAVAPAPSSFERGSRLRRPVKGKGALAAEPAVLENRANAVRAEQLRKIEVLKEDLANNESAPFKRGSTLRRPVQGGAPVASEPLKRQASIRGSLAAPKRTLADLTWGKKPQSVVKQLGLDVNPQEEMARHLGKYDAAHGVKAGFSDWLARNNKVSNPDTYHQYLVLNHRSLLPDYHYEYGQPNYGYYQRPKLAGIHDDPEALVHAHQQKWGLKSRYEAWFKQRGVRPSAKAYHDFVRETQAKPLYQRLGYVA